MIHPALAFKQLKKGREELVLYQVMQSTCNSQRTLFDGKVKNVDVDFASIENPSVLAEHSNVAHNPILCLQKR